MSEPLVAITGETHPCFQFYQRMINCKKTEPLWSRMCTEKIEDWYECRTAKKHRSFYSFINNELHKLKIYSLPTYDYETDTFKDGPLPKDADGYFSLDKEKQTYYSQPE